MIVIPFLWIVHDFPPSRLACERSSSCGRRKSWRCKASARSLTAAPRTRTTSDDSGDSGGVHKGSLKILEVSYGIVVFFFCQGVT